MIYVKKLHILKAILIHLIKNNNNKIMLYILIMSIDKSNINKIKIGKYAGTINQGDNAIAIGSFAGRTNQTANSIIINAIGIDVSSMDISGLFISPIRRQNGITQSLYYNPTTSEIVYGDISSSGSGGGGGGSGTNYWSLSSGNLYNNVGTNIGIGTTTPIYTLDVSGRTIIRDSLYMHNTDISDVSGIYFRDGTYIGHGSSFDIRSNEVIKFNNEKFIINTDGNIGVGKLPLYDIGFNNQINVIKYSIIDNSLYVGGDFTEIIVDGITSNVSHICKINLTTGYVDNMNGGLDSTAEPFNTTCYSIDIDNNNNVYVGGIFDNVGNYIAMWNGSQWDSASPIPTFDAQLTNYFTGIPRCTDIKYDNYNNILYFGGSFTSVGGLLNEAVLANNIARWSINTSSWENIGDLNNECFTIAINETSLGTYIYVGGSFNSAAGVSVNNIALYELYSGWSDIDGGLNNACRTLIYDNINNILYAGGEFNSAGGISANRIAKFDGTSWQPLEDGLNDTCFSLSIDSNSNIYAGGFFSNKGNSIAKWNGTSWTNLENGLLDTSEFPFTNCRTIEIINDNSIYVGGQFNIAGGISANRIAYWNGNIWANTNISSPYSIDIAGDLGVRDSAFKPSGGSWSSISDIRMKTNIELANNTYLKDIIDDFPLYMYKWNNEFLNNYKNEYYDNQFGTIAQELLVLSNKYPELSQSVSIINDTKYNNFYIVNASQYIYVLIGAVKELIKDTDYCETEINNIKKNMNNLINK